MSAPFQAAPANRTGFVRDTGSSARIAAAGTLGLLSQSVPAAACHARLGVERRASARVLAAAPGDFERSLAALTEGDAGQGIVGAERGPAVLRALDAVDAAWAPLEETLKGIGAAQGGDLAATGIARQSALVLDRAQRVVSEVAGRHAHPTILLQRDALTLTLADRQRMLAQRIAKAHCFVALTPEVPGAREELTESVKLFGATLGALRDGAPALGLPAAESPDIVAALATLEHLWATAEPTLAATLGGAVAEPEDLALVYETMQQVAANTGYLVELYAQGARLGL